MLGKQKMAAAAPICGAAAGLGARMTHWPTRRAGGASAPTGRLRTVSPWAMGFCIGFLHALSL